MVLLPERRALERDPEERRGRNADVPNLDTVASVFKSFFSRFSRVDAGPIREPHSGKPRDTGLVKSCINSSFGDAFRDRTGAV